LLLLPLVAQLPLMHCLLLPLLAHQSGPPLALLPLLVRWLLGLLVWWVTAAGLALPLHLRAGVLGPPGLHCCRCHCWALVQS